MTQPPAPSARTQVRRQKKRGRYDRELIDQVLDEGLVCHVGFVVDGEPVVIPTTYARVGDTLYVHGAVASRTLEVMASGAPVCVTVTLLDGLVLARSTFHHSMNYRSVVVFGVARDVTELDERARALDAIVEHVTPGRSAHARGASPSELAATRVVALPITESSAKVREGGPLDDAEDLALPHWAGVIPLAPTPSAPIPAPELPPMATPRHVWQRAARETLIFEERRDDLVLSSDPARLDLDRLHELLSERSYWAKGIARARMERALYNSLCVGVYRGEEQLGFARLVTDRATFAWLADVFVVESERGQGIAAWMVGALRARPELSGLRRWMLGTRDAHELYARFGFAAPAHPERLMEIVSDYEGRGG